MRLGIDLDGCVYDFVNDFCDFAAERLDREMTPIVPKWNFYTQLGLTEDVFWELVREGIDAGVIFRKGLPYPKAIETLKNLRDDGHSLHVITHRMFGPNAVTNTMDWFRVWEMPYDTITFAKDKTVVAVDLLLDDMPENIEASIAAGIPAVIMERTWNSDKSRFYPSVSSWPEFREFVSSFASLEDSIV
jgi:5'(3')-deoxyribonucleotidase